MTDEPFRVASAMAEDWAQAAEAVAEGLGAPDGGSNLGFLYVSDRLASDAGKILDFLKDKTGIPHWAGTVGLGLIAGGEEYFDRPAVCAMTARLPAEVFRVFPSVNDGLSEIAREVRTWAAAAAPVFGIVHGDPNNASVPGLVEEAAGMLPAFLVGALTASRADCPQFADTLTGGGLSGVLFGVEAQIQTGLSQGFVPIGETHVVSESTEQVLIALDGRPALEVFVEDLGELGEDLSQLGGQIHVALPVAGSDTGDYTVRNLMGIDPERGWIAAACELAPGERVMFVRRDRVSAEVDLRNMAKRVRERLAEPPRGALYVSCIARGPNMFEGTTEAQVVQEAIGAEVPLIGVYANGEISNNRLYGYTGVLTLFP